MRSERSSGDLEGPESAPRSVPGPPSAPRSEAFSWLQSAEKKEGAPMPPMFGWLSKPNAYHNASTSSSPGSAPGSPATPSPVPQRALQDPLAFKRVATTANRPLEYRGRSNHLEGTQTQRENYPQVERVWSDTDNSPAVVEVSVDNDYGRIDSTPASPSSQRVLWMPPPTQLPPPPGAGVPADQAAAYNRIENIQNAKTITTSANACARQLRRQQ